MIHHKRRRWYLLATKYQQYHFERITGVDVIEELFGANIIIETQGKSTVTIIGFSKKKARKVLELCSKHITRNSSRNIIDTLNTNLESLANSKGSGSLADELKKMKELLDSGIITQTEFDEQKSKLLNK